MSSIYGFFTGSHSPSISLLKDGKIVFCIEEERLTRIKSGDNYDINCELSCVEAENFTGLKITDADYRIFANPTPDAFARRITNYNYEKVSHHTSHAYGAYFTSGMKGKAITITYDGGGESNVMKVYLCDNGKMSLIQSHPLASFGSLSHVWGFSTSSMKGYDQYGEGIWKMCKDEGKLMGMGPNGYYDEKIYKMLSSVINYKNFRFYPSASSSKTRFLGDMLKINGYFDTQEKMEIYSYNLQKITEDLFLKFINDLHNLYPEYRQLCFGGGLFANVKMNQKINELNWVDEIYIYPPMGDEGLSLGACIHKAVELGEITEPFEFNDVYFGKSYNNDEIYEISKNYNFIRKEYIPSEIAKNINEGEIVGWFQSGSEYGPRALGARSILVRPTEVSTHKVLNQRLNRYDTMPFAPIIMEEYFDYVFTPSKSKYTSEFMTLCYNTNEEWIDRIPSVIQKSDKTARPQIVKKSKIPKFWEILNEYNQLSGIPLLLNTSFNSHNQPIIENPQQAFESLKLGVIDKLIIEDYVYFT
jgi:carbamoyltransferase